MWQRWRKGEMSQAAALVSARWGSRDRCVEGAAHRGMEAWLCPPTHPLSLLAQGFRRVLPRANDVWGLPATTVPSNEATNVGGTPVVVPPHPVPIVAAQGFRRVLLRANAVRVLGATTIPSNEATRVEGERRGHDTDVGGTPVVVPSHPAPIVACARLPVRRRLVAVQVCGPRATRMPTMAE